jgi:two-component system copper resistance phosphate regulon response regulator CusR
VLLLVPGDDVSTRVAGLDAGADDCIGMPVASAELQARARALARRGEVSPAQLCAGDLVLDLVARRARRAGRPLQLTLREFQLLEYLIRRRDRVVSRDDIWRALWSGQRRASFDNAIDVHMARLRKKVDANAPVRLIHTVRGVGFVFGAGGLEQV